LAARNSTRVVKRFEAHEDAARWYKTRGLPLPSNCVVSGNSPILCTLPMEVVGTLADAHQLE
jgi:hypothetical protein